MKKADDSQSQYCRSVEPTNEHGNRRLEVAMRGSPAEEEDRKMTAAGMGKRVGGGLEGRETVTDEKRSGRGFGKGREGPNWGRRDGCEDSRKGREGREGRERGRRCRYVRKEVPCLLVYLGAFHLVRNTSYNT